jgi:hypothetical protein
MVTALKKSELEFQARDLAILRGLFDSRVATIHHLSTLYFGGRLEAARKRVQKLKAAGILNERPRKATEPSIYCVSRRAFEILEKHGVLREYAATLSTASTQLIAIAHTIYSDVLQRSSRWQDPTLRAQTHEIWVTRAIVIVSAIAAIVVVEVLSALGFTIADLVFSIYGAQLGLCPPVFLALFVPRHRLSRIPVAATLGVLTGFIAGWASAIVGKKIGSDNLVFLAPAVSLAASSFVIFPAFFITQMFQRNRDAGR